MGENGYIGRCIGNYRIVASLGSGGFGSVYRGVHTILTERTVAIKILHTYLASQEECERFLQEARLLEHLQHPHILRVLDVGIDERVPYLVAEFAPNGSLRNLLKRSAPRLLPVETSLTIISQVGEALDYAHQQQIVHRDLKPENILFDGRGEALLADFGIATELTTSSVKQVTVTGTPLYMAPEQFQGAASKESDQYALACIAYELFTGRAPFTASDFFALGFKHISEQPAAPTQFNPALPAQIEAAILKAMSKQRGERFADLRAFLAAMQGHGGASDAMMISDFRSSQVSLPSASIPTLSDSQAPAGHKFAQANAPEIIGHHTPLSPHQRVQDTPFFSRQGPVTPIPPLPTPQFAGDDYPSTQLTPYALGHERSGSSAFQEPVTPVPTQAAGSYPTGEVRAWRESGQAFPFNGGIGNGAGVSSARQRGAGRRKIIVAAVGGAIALVIGASLLFAFFPSLLSPRVITQTVYRTVNVTTTAINASGSPVSHHTPTVGSKGNTKAQATPTPVFISTPISPVNPTVIPTSGPTHVAGPTPTSVPTFSPTPSPTSPPDLFRVYFDAATSNGLGVSTQSAYSGAVSITISGYGQASGTEYSDAFYIYTDSSGNPITPHPATCWVLFINGNPAADSVGLPAYNSSHVYTVTMTLSQPATINFGICDGQSSDNTGYLTVEVQEQ